MLMGSQRQADLIRRVINQYSDMLYRMSLILLCNEQDAEDVLQEVFIRYLNKKHFFRDSEHEKAWLIRVTYNACIDIIRARKKYSHANIDVFADYGDGGTHSDIYEKVISLPENYKVVIMLYYYEGYSVREISKFLKISESNVKIRLMRGRKILELQIENEESKQS